MRVRLLLVALVVAGLFSAGAAWAQPGDDNPGLARACSGPAGQEGRNKHCPRPSDEEGSRSEDPGDLSSLPDDLEACSESGPSEESFECAAAETEARIAGVAAEAEATASDPSEESFEAFVGGVAGEVEEIVEAQVETVRSELPELDL